MKNKHISLRGVMLLCIVAMFSLPSCEWFREDPLWIGKWQYKDKIYVGDITYNTYMQYLIENVTGEFEADEDWLWLVRDRYNDGDTEDDGEDVDFERL